MTNHNIIMTIQEALCIHESPRDCSLLLRHTLQFFTGSSRELCLLRETCREFKRCADTMIQSELKRLLGPHVMHPMPGQSYGEIYDVALNELDERSRKSLRDECNDLPNLRSCGFELGLIGRYTRDRCEYYKINKAINIICIIPVRFEGKRHEDEQHTTTMIAKVPIGVSLHQTPAYLNDKTKSITAVYLDPKFLHMNRDTDGDFYVNNHIGTYCRERNLKDTMHRVQSELLTYEATIPNAKCAYSTLLHSTQYGGSSQDYEEYHVECLKNFRTFQLGEKLPNLESFDLCVLNELRMNKMKKKYIDKIEIDYKQAKEKIIELEKEVSKKYRLEEIKRLVQLAFVVGLGVLVFFETCDLWKKVHVAIYVIWKVVEGSYRR